MPRYLFGPVPAAFADQNLDAPRREGRCLTFGAAGADVPAGHADTWEQVAARLPAGWEPDCVVLYLPYTLVPPALWSAPVPLVGLAADWNWCWHAYRRLLPRCEVVLADSPGVEVMRAAGLAHARPANLFGCERAFLEPPPAEGPRDIDVLFVGNLHPAVQRRRLPWLGRLARLARRWNVVIATGVHGDDYRALLDRARVVFNHSARGECNRRAFEAAARGCLLFQEAGNPEVHAYFRDRRECVLYGEDDLEDLLGYYLAHEDERRALAESARERVLGYGFAALFERALDELDWGEARGRAAGRLIVGGEDDLLARTAEALAAGLLDPALAADLSAAAAARPDSAALHNALGLVTALAGQSAGRPPAACAAEAGAHFVRALSADGGQAVAALNLAEALTAAGQADAVVDVARRTLALLARGPAPDPAWLDAGHFPLGFDLFRVEWERAAWGNAGDPAAEARAKRDLLAWRLHTLLADLTGDLVHYHQAALLRPDLPATQAALGCALGRAGRPAEALPHLRRAVAGNPFDGPAARALYQALGETGNADESARLARDRRLLARAAPGVVPAEDWFVHAPPVGDELASIIVLCCNEVEYTRTCLESVLRHTRAPYELVLVDNGSTDGTAEYLEGLRRRAGPARVEVVTNTTNLGFAAGCNQGLARAEGRYLVFLNNDTVVTEGWLEGLIAWARHDWPRVGLVGAVSNYTRPPQLVQAEYNSLDEMPGFAARRRREFARQAVECERLTGFCLLARREVLEQLGGFDERYGLGLFEDDDLSVRARRAGYRLLAALDVFVHHFGSRTFTALGVDTEKALAENFKEFRAKWGPEEAAGYRLPGRGSAEAAPAARAEDEPPPSAPRAPRVSLCMIVRNEEANLPACLESAAGLFDEVVVVDTGSTDRTKEVAVRHGAKVYDFPWCDSFAAARNESLRHATGEWVFWLDADDRLVDENREKLRALFAGLGQDEAAYSMKCRCVADPATGAVTDVDHVRLFRNHPGVRWEYRVHEQVLPSVRRLGHAVRWADVVIHHTGYTDPALRARKLGRDLRLLQMEQAERPDDPFTLFNLGCAYHQELGRHAEALPLLRRSLALSHPSDSIVRKLYAMIAGCHRRLGQDEQAVAACREGLGHYPDDCELLFLAGQLLLDRGDLAGAEGALRRLLEGRPGRHFASLDAGLRGYKARHNLGVVYHKQGRPALAEEQWRAALAERPDFLPAWLALGELALSGRRWQDLEEVARAAGAQAGGGTEASVLRARGHMARGEYGPARGLLERATAEAPRALWPRVVLSHALLQEGRDPEAAEGALRAVLDLDPHNAEAHHNLAVLLGRRREAARDAAFLGNVALAQLYHDACARPSDINEHLPTLYALAKECRHVTEFGTRTGMSTTALLYAQPAKLVCYDRVRYPQVDRLAQLAGATEFVFEEQGVLWADIEGTDLLFIDTLHTYAQLSQELRLHAGKVHKYVVLHDTSTFGEVGEEPGQRGLWPAVEEFLAHGSFRLKTRYENNNGLTILERVRAEGAMAR